MSTGTGLMVGGADRFEAQAEANEARIFALAASGRWESIYGALAGRADGLVDGTSGARIQRRPIGGPVLRASLYGIIGRSLGGGDGVTVKTGAGNGSLTIGVVKITWPSAAATGGLARPSMEVASQGGATPAPSGFEAVLGNSSGQPLAGQIKKDMEAAFGRDFSNVRVHVDGSAQTAAQAIGARAFTKGSDLYFNAGQYDPHSAGGKALIGHELTHVLQSLGAAALRCSPLGQGGMVSAAAERSAASHDVTVRRKQHGFVGQVAGEVRGKGASAGGAPAGFEALLASSRGDPLPTEVAARLGSWMGADFGGVRVHNDPPAHMAAMAVQAEAFAMGRDIYFAPGRYDPNSARGVALIGHELTHVLQDHGGAADLHRKEAKVTHPDATLEDRDLADIEFEQLAAQFKKAYKEKWYIRKDQDPEFAGNMSESANWVRSLMGQKEVYAGCRNFAGDTFELLTHMDPRYHVVEHISGFREGEVGGTGIRITNFAPHQVARVTNVITGEQTVFDMWSIAGGWGVSGGGEQKDPDWSKAIHPFSTFGYKLGLEVDQKSQVFPQTWKSYRFGGKQHGVPYNTSKPAEFKRKGLHVAGHDGLEDQALRNERAIYSAMQGGRGPSLLALSASRRHGRRRRGNRRGVRRKDSWYSGIGSFISNQLEENKKFWDDVGTNAVSWGMAGADLGGVRGYTQAALGYTGGAISALFSGINQPELTVAYLEGLGTGVKEGVKGLVNMVVHPIETAQGIYKLVVNFDEAKEGLKQKVDEYVQAASSDPVKFARMTGELVGQIEVALVGPKVIGGPKEVLGAMKTLRNVVPKGRTLWFYSDEIGGAAIKNSSTIGRSGATFATGLDPLLGGSRSLMGIFARNVFLGGRLDFVKQAGSFLPKARLKAAFTTATGFKGGAFRHIWFTEVETALTRAAKGVFPQYAASTPQQVKIVAQLVLADPKALHALLDGAGMLGTAGNLVVGNTEVSFGELLDSTLEYYGLRKERDGADEIGEYLRDPRARERIELDMDALDEPGLPLEQAVRRRLEMELGADLSSVRVHTGLKAERLAESIGAEAFTIGNKIFMGAGAWNPDSPEGMGTLVHEATHVVQAEQGRLTGPGTPARTRALEAEAHGREHAFMAGHVAMPKSPTRGPGARAVPAPMAAPDLTLRDAPREAAIPAPVAETAAPSRVLKKGKSRELAGDPVRQVMSQWNMGELSREEFLETCTEQVLALMRDEIELAAERGESLAWSKDLPQA